MTINTPPASEPRKPSKLSKLSKLKDMDRRKFLGSVVSGGVALGSATFVGSTLLDAAGRNKAWATEGDTLNIPDLLTGTTTDGVKVYDLTMQTGNHEVLPDITSETAGFNGSFLGPSLKMANGDSVKINVTNKLGSESTVHWHGAHIPPSVDGGPQNIIADGETWSPAFEVMQEAATLWYHPHALTTTAEQVTRGLAGMIIVEDDSDATKALPSDYGVDDIPIIMQCLAVGSNGDIKHDAAGYRTSEVTFPLLCNGTNIDSAPVTFTATKKRTRLRLLNASPSDFLTIGRKDGVALTQVATEGGYLNSALEVSGITIAPGNRAEIILELEEAVTLQAVIDAHFIAGGSGTRDFLTITPSASDTPADLPSTLNAIERIDTSGATTRTIRLTQSGGAFGINGVSGVTMEAMESSMIMVDLDATEVWTIVNETQLSHPFHLHDVPHQIVSYNGEDPIGTQLGWQDTTIIMGTGTVEIAMKFTDFADSEYMYMLHCHILQHEDGGMMAGLIVMDSST